MTDVLEKIKNLVVSVTPVGSRVTCDPPPVGTDEDYLVLYSKMQGKALFETLEDDDWCQGGSMIPDEANLVATEDRFYAYRHGDLNLIITRSPTFHRRFLAASSIAKRLNLLDKDDRIALFQAVLYGNSDGCRDHLQVAIEEPEIAF